MATRRRSTLNPSTVARFQAIATSAKELENFRGGIGGPTAPSRMRTAADIIGATSVLDIGCGPGVFVETLNAQPLRPLRYLGIDGSPAFVRLADDAAARSQIKDAAARVHVLDEPLPFVADEFDAVVVRHVLEHLENPLFALSEAARVCKQTLVIVFSQFPTTGSLSLLTDAHMNLPRWAHSIEKLESTLQQAQFVLPVQDQYDPALPPMIMGAGEVPRLTLVPREAYWVATPLTSQATPPGP